jgi:hypothetical protein
VKEAVTAYEEARANVKQLKELLKQAHAELQQAEDALISAMADNELEAIKMDGYSYSASTKITASAGGRMEDLVMAFVDNGLEDMVTQSVHAQRLASWVKDLDDEGLDGAEQLQARAREFLGTDALNVHERLTVNRRRS